MDNIKILDVKWFNDIGIVTIYHNCSREKRTYIGKVLGENETEDIEFIIDYGTKIYLEDLKSILELYE